MPDHRLGRVVATLDQDIGTQLGEQLKRRRLGEDHDRIDEWVIRHLEEFEGRPLRDAARGTLDLGAVVPDGERKAAEVKAVAMEPLWQRVAARLGDKLAGVRASVRLADSAACLVRDEHDLGPQLRRVLEAAGQAVPPSRPWLELNASHPLVRRLQDLPDGESFDELAGLLHEQAVLVEGGTLVDPAGFVRRINRLIGGDGATGRIITPNDGA